MIWARWALGIIAVLVLLGIGAVVFMAHYMSDR